MTETKNVHEVRKLLRLRAPVEHKEIPHTIAENLLNRYLETEVTERHARALVPRYSAFLRKIGEL